MPPIGRIFAPASQPDVTGRLCSELPEDLSSFERLMTPTKMITDADQEGRQLFVIEFQLR